MILTFVGGKAFTDPEDALAELRRQEAAGRRPDVTRWTRRPVTACTGCGRLFPQRNKAPGRCWLCEGEKGKIDPS